MSKPETVRSSGEAMKIYDGPMAWTVALRRKRCYLGAAPLLGDSLAVEHLALTRVALVRIQVPQPFHLNLWIFGFISFPFRDGHESVV
jgi:hypothetical protein